MPSPEINLFHSAPCNPHVNAEQESDIVDHHQSFRQVMKDDEIYQIPPLNLPTRPTSRLGFNTVTLTGPPPCSPLAGTCGGEWTPALLQRGEKDSDPSADSIDITTCSCPSFGGQVSPMTSFSAVNPQPHHRRKEEKQAEYGPEEIDSSRFPCKDRPRTAPSVAFKTQNVAKTPSVSRLSFPFNSTSARRRPPPPPPPPVRRSYSSLPSPLSPTPMRPLSKINQPTRHNYRHHGHSNHRLQYLKWFWSIREHDPDAVAAQAGDDTAHGNPRKIPNGIGLTSYPPRRSPAQPNSQQCALPPITIHPRRGDISALRDPDCVDIDRCFAALPLWTIGKTLWMIDVHMLCAGPTDDGAVESDDDVFDETASEISIDTSSIVSSDDSDATLVESGSEGDLVEYQGRHIIAKDAETESVNSPHKKGRHYLGFVSANKMRLRTDLGFPADHALSRPSESKRTQLNGRSSWASNWCRRWEMLIELSGNDRERQATLFGSTDAPIGVTSRVEATSKHPAKFFFAEDEAQDDDAGNCVDDNFTISCRGLNVPEL